jgi:hypothetical protein
MVLVPVIGFSFMLLVSGLPAFGGASFHAMSLFLLFLLAFPLFYLPQTLSLEGAL